MQYSTTLTRLDPVGTNSVRVSSDEVTIHAEEYLTEIKSRRAFDASLYEANILPILVRLENTGRDTLIIDAETFTLQGESRLVPLSPDHVANKAARDGTKDAVGWGLVVPLITIPAAMTLSAISTHTANTRMASDLHVKSFGAGKLESGEHRSGFVFFTIEPREKSLLNLNLQISLKYLAPDQKRLISVPLPDLDLSKIQQKNANN
jgi:hypothetical protein